MRPKYSIKYHFIRLTPLKPFVFPFILVLGIFLLSAFKISGSSVGIYDYIFGGSTANTIIGSPRPVRSDEWLVNTPFVVAQSENGYKIFNPDIGSGKDVAIALDVPYLDWSALFRPQNALFFIAPLEVAFAFKWWLLCGLLLLAVYLFILKLYPKRYLTASVIAVFFTWSPFVQWWYQTATLLPIAYSLLGIVTFLKFIECKRLLHKVLLSLSLIYLAVSFALLMYPAFQIITGIASCGIIFAILLADKQLKLLLVRRNLTLLVVVFTVSVAIVAAFLIQHREAATATLSTEYPGARSVHSGGFNTAALATWPFSYLLLNDRNSNALGDNQSEASGFALFGIVTLPFLLFEYLLRNKGSLRKRELYLIYAMCALLIGIGWRMVIPFGDAGFNLLGLSKVPHVRLIIAVGIVNLVLITILVGRKGYRLTSVSQIVSRHHIYTFFATLFIYLTANYYAISSLNITAIGWKQYFIISLLMSVITSALLSRYRILRYIGLSLALLFTTTSSATINPMQRGLAAMNNTFTTYVKNEESKNTSYWVSEQPPLSAMLVAAGAETYSGVHTYPKLSVWSKYFPKSTSIYNRYAHVQFYIDQNNHTPTISLLQADSFQITLSDCSPILKDLHIDYIVSERSFQNICFTKHERRLFENKILHIYSR